MYGPLSAIAMFLGAVLPAQAARVEIPLSLETGIVEARVAAALGLDAEGAVTLTADGCNQVTLSGLALLPADGYLRLATTVDAQAGTELFGGCVGMIGWRGRLLALIRPRVSPDGLVISLSPESAELRQPDGSPGLLTRPARLLAEHLVLPRLDDARLDLRAPLQSLDEMLAGFLSARDGPQLQDRVRLGRVEVRDGRVVAGLVLEVAPSPAADAPPEPPLDDWELAQWQRLEDELDGFLTAVISHLAARSGDADLRIEMLGVLLDSRLAIARSLSGEDGTVEEPVRELFVESWDRLRPLVAQLAAGTAGEEFQALQLTTFMAGADAIRAIDALGPAYGIEINRDGLRRLARMLLAGEAPASFTPLPLDVDRGLRSLFGIGPMPEPGPMPSPRPGPLSRALDVLLPPARAAEIAPDPATMLRSLLPRLSGLEQYMRVVAGLLERQTSLRLARDSRMPADYRDMLDPLVRATAWKETCWRHYLDGSDPPRVIRSSVGAVGMMQINVRVWRGLYDMNRLEADVGYNVAAGIEILEHYFVDFALRRGEHRLPGGSANLARATYAAYNGGPGQMARYRKENTPARLRAIDAAFWSQYQHLTEQRLPDVRSCYSVR